MAHDFIDYKKFSWMVQPQNWTRRKPKTSVNIIVPVYARNNKRNHNHHLFTFVGCWWIEGPTSGTIKHPPHCCEDSEVCGVKLWPVLKIKRISFDLRELPWEYTRLNKLRPAKLDLENNSSAWTTVVDDNNRGVGSQQLLLVDCYGRTSEHRIFAYKGVSTNDARW